MKIEPKRHFHLPRDVTGARSQGGRGGVGVRDMSGTVVEKFFVQNDVENTLVTLIKPRVWVRFALEPFF